MTYDDDKPSKSFSTMLSQFLAINSKPTVDTFPELADIMVWFRFLLGIMYGVFLGLYGGDRGYTGALFGLNVITFVPYMYVSTMLNADSDSYGTKVIFGGVINAVALMVLIWVYFYTIEHSAEEAQMVKALLSSVVLDQVAEEAEIPLDSAMGDVAAEAALNVAAEAASASATIAPESEF